MSVVDETESQWFYIYSAHQTVITVIGENYEDNTTQMFGQICGALQTTSSFTQAQVNASPVWLLTVVPNRTFCPYELCIQEPKLAIASYLLTGYMSNAFVMNF